MNLFNHIEGVIKGKKRVLKEFYGLAKLEIKLAKLSIFPLLASFLGIVCLLMVSWLMLMLLIAVLLLPIIGSLALVLLILLLLNGSLILYFVCLINKKIHALGLPNTRKTLAQIV